MKNIIRDLRKEKSLSQEALSKLLGVSRQTINALEKGRYNPSIILAFKISNVLGMSIEEIFLYEEEVDE